MIQNTTCPSKVESYSARHLFFHVKHFVNDPIELLSLTNTKRFVYVWPSHRRSKYIAVTSNAHLMMTHLVKNKTASICVLPVEIGALHHYRHKALNPPKPGEVTDKSVYIYSPEITSRVASVLADFEH